ncbi:MAG: phosphopyruvate hydratase [Candidatus Woesearchaeota archaeon]
MNKIIDVKAREVLDSRGNPTIEAEVRTLNAIGVAMVPSGASTGTHEAVELRDGGQRYLGLGVLKAVRNVNAIIKPKLIGMNVEEQEAIDNLMIKLDGTPNKKRLGANAILAVSLACARCAASSNHEELYAYLGKLHGTTTFSLPTPYLNIINGGRHADNKLAVQEFMIIPKGKNFNENIVIASEFYHTLKGVIKHKYGGQSTGVGDEGGFAPKVDRVRDALDLLVLVRRQLGMEKKVGFGTDVAASEFYDKGKYVIDSQPMNKEEYMNYLSKIVKEYNLESVEDPLNEDDFEGFRKFSEMVKARVVGDDLLCTNPKRIKQAILMKSCNVLLLKVNQIGTLTEAMRAAKMAQSAEWDVMVSHRSGETEDTFIADLAVGIGARMIKSGAPCRSERTAKYNRLMKISELLGQ